MSPRETHVLAAVPTAPQAVPTLRVTNDAIPHREPGTTDADLLTGAGATHAVLAVAALGVPRLRAGIRRVAARSAPGTVRPADTF
jgi:hypothetical protein